MHIRLLSRKRTHIYLSVKGGFGLVKAGTVKEGDHITVDYGGDGVVTSLPFYKR